MDRELTTKEKWQDRRKIILRWSLGGAVAVVAVVLLAVLIQPSVRESGLRLATVDTGSIEFAVSATGKVVPGYEEVINSPISSRVVEVYKRAGEVVQAGEPLLRLDLAAVQTEYDNMLDEERMKELQLEKLRITNRNNITEMEMNIDIQEMELDRKAAALRNEKYLDSLGAGTPDKVREAELDYTVSSLKLEDNRRKLQNQRDLAAADEAVAELELSIFRKNKEQTRRRLYDAGVRAPYAATLTFINSEIGAQVGQGEKLAMLADLTRFKVEGELGDMQAGKIAEGYRTTVLAGRDTLTGMVSVLSPMSTDGLISFTVQLDDESAPSLRSGLKCDIYVVYAYRENVLRLPSGTYYKGEGNYDLFVREGDRLVRRRVALGEANYDYVEVISGIEPGEQVVISDMQDYAKQPELKIKPSKKK